MKRDETLRWTQVMSQRPAIQDNQLAAIDHRNGLLLQDQPEINVGQVIEWYCQNNVKSEGDDEIQSPPPSAVSGGNGMDCDFKTTELGPSSYRWATQQSAPHAVYPVLERDGHGSLDISTHHRVFRRLRPDVEKVLQKRTSIT